MGDPAAPRRPRVRRLRLRFIPENTQAAAFYRTLGFRNTGEVEDGEIVMELRATTG